MIRVALQALRKGWQTSKTDLGASKAHSGDAESHVGKGTSPASPQEPEHPRGNADLQSLTSLDSPAPTKASVAELAQTSSWGRRTFLIAAVTGLLTAAATVITAAFFMGSYKEKIDRLEDDVAQLKQVVYVGRIESVPSGRSSRGSLSLRPFLPKSSSESGADSLIRPGSYSELDLVGLRTSDRFLSYDGPRAEIDSICDGQRSQILTELNATWLTIDTCIGAIQLRSVGGYAELRRVTGGADEPIVRVSGERRVQLSGETGVLLVGFEL